MKFAFSETRNGTKTIHFIFSERESRVLVEIVGDLNPLKVHENLDEDLSKNLTKEEVSKFLSSLFEALQKCL